jgi:tight adherence protein C
VIGVTAGVLAAFAATLLMVALRFRLDPPIAGSLDVLRPGSSSKARSTPRRLARWLGARGPVQRLPSRGYLERRLGVAAWSTTSEEIKGAKVLAGAAGLLFGVLGPMPPAAPLLAVGAYLVPDVLLARAARRRRLDADSEVPQLLDLLAASSTAGLSTLLALRRAAEGVRGPLADELRSILQAVGLGARWRDSLLSAAERLELRDLRRAVLAMGRTESLGTPLAAALREQAEDVRERRRTRAAEAARKAPVKMLFPLVFMILPAFLLLTVVPVLLATLRSIR